MSYYVRKNSSHMILFGTDFNADSVQSWLRRNWKIAYCLAFLYVVSIYVIQQIMKNRKKFELKTALTVWNALLASFSIYIASSVFTSYYPFIKEHGWTRFLCDSTPTRRDAKLVFLGVLFLISKFVEFGDTTFIVLRKRELILLHWFHHVSVAVLAWEAGVDGASSAQLAVMINSFVHSWMYSYFALKCMGYKIPKSVSMLLTGLQILQIFIACLVGVWLWIKSRDGLECEISNRFLCITNVLCFSYLFLFIKFFRDEYIKPVKICITKKLSAKSD